MEQLQTIIQKHCFIENKDEVATMLNFYHDLGVIVKHGNTVILQAEWLIKLFKQLITVRCFDGMVRRKRQLHFHTLKLQCGSDLKYHLTSRSVFCLCFVLVCFGVAYCVLLVLDSLIQLILLSAALPGTMDLKAKLTISLKTLDLTVQLELSGVSA